MKKEKDMYEEFYGRLIGKTVVKIIRCKDPLDDETVYGICFQDMTVAWVLSDPEGNGPGFLDVCDPPVKKKK